MTRATASYPVSLEQVRQLARGRFGDMMINLRPSFGNRSRGVDDPSTREAIVRVVERLVCR